MSTLRHSALVSTPFAQGTARVVQRGDVMEKLADSSRIIRHLKVAATENLATTFADSITRLRTRTMAVSDMSEYTVTVAPDDWTVVRWSNGNTLLGADPAASSDITSVSTKKLNYFANTTARQASSWNDVNNFTDGDILMLTDHPTSGGTNSLSGPVFRGSGGSGTEQGYTLYKTTTAFILAKYDGGGVRTTIVTIPATWFITADQPIWWRVNVSGTAIKVKVWDYNCYEPDNWLIDTTDADIAGPGWVGIASAATTTLSLYYAAVSFNAAAPYSIPSSYIPNKYFSTISRGGPNATSANLVRLQSAYFTTSTRNLIGCGIYWDGTHAASRQHRLAVYSGGTGSDPTGATLLYDFGQTTGVLLEQWQDLSCPPTAIPQNTWLWLGTKMDASASIRWSDEASYAQDLSLNGANTPVTISANSADAWPATIPEAGTFAAAWYQIRIQTEVAANLSVSITDNLNSWSDSASITQNTPHISVQVSDDLNQVSDTNAALLRFRAGFTDDLGTSTDALTVVRTEGSSTPIVVNLTESWGLLGDSAQSFLLSKLTASITDSWELLNDSIQFTLLARLTASITDPWELLNDSVSVSQIANLFVAITEPWGLLADALDRNLGLIITLSDTISTPTDSIANTLIATYPQHHTLLLIKDLVEIEGRAGWMYDHYNPGIVSHYGEEGENVHSMLCGGANGNIYQLTGLSDAGYPFPCEVLTKALDQNDPRHQKLYGDIMVDAITQSADITAVLGFDNNTIQTAPYAINTATRQQIPVPAGDPWRTARNICLQLSWKQSSTPAYLYIWEPRFTEESNNLYAYTWSTAYLTHGIKGYFIHGYLYLQHNATADITFSIIDEDNVVAAAVVFPADIGYTQKQFMRLPAVKGKFFKYTVSSSAPFRLDGSNSELLVRPWGSSEPWQRKRIFKDIAQMGSSDDQVLSNTQ